MIYLIQDCYVTDELVYDLLIMDVALLYSRSLHMHSLAHIKQTKSNVEQPQLHHLWLELTRKCNLQCVHCYANSGPNLPISDGLETKDWMMLLESAREQGCSSVQFIGGEPLLHPDLITLLHRARSLQYDDIEVFTNATRVTSEWAKVFAELNVKVALSFYSTDEDEHEAITSVPGSYSRTVRGIDIALASKVQVRVGIIQVSQSDEEIERAKKLLTSRGVSEVRVDRVRGVGRADQAITFSSPKQQLTELCGACSDGKLCVTSNGDSFPCIMARAWPLGDAREGIEKILDGKALAAFRAEQQRQSEEAMVASCGPDDCGPYCRPNCGPYDDCSPKCGPSCSPPCSPICLP